MKKLSDYYGSPVEIEDLFESIAAKHGLYFYKKQEFLPTQIRTNSIYEILNNPFDNGDYYVVIGYSKKFRLSYRIGKLSENVDLDENLRKFTANSAEKCGLTARGIMRILRLARTIADLQNEKKVSKMHIMEALSYRHRLFKNPY